MVTRLSSFAKAAEGRQDNKAARLISKHGNILSRIETEILLTHLLNCSRIDLYIGDVEISDKTERQYDSLVARRLRGEPVQYIVGKTEFMGFDFIMGKGVFIPRPETELLVDEIVSSGVEHPASGARILDLCTGSGNIAVSLAKLMPRAKITAIDISSSALNAARKNALYNNVADRIKFYQGDLFNALAYESVDKNNEFDIIVSNPPYVKSDEITLLQKEIGFEPEIALNGGKDGLDFYRRMAEKAWLYLNEGGALFLEIGFGQSKDIVNIFNMSGKFTVVKIERDFNKIERVLVLSLK